MLHIKEIKVVVYFFKIFLLYVSINILKFNWISIYKNLWGYIIDKPLLFDQYLKKPIESTHIDWLKIISSDEWMEMIYFDDDLDWHVYDVK